MNFVNKENGIGLFFQLGQQGFQALLEITAVLGSRQQSTKIQRIDSGIEQRLRYLLLHDHPRQAFSDRGLADPGLTHQQRVVLAATAENLRCTLNLECTAHQRVNTVFTSQYIQVGRIVLQRAGL